MSDAASRPADRTRLAWQRSLLLIAGTAAVLYKDAADDGQALLGAAGSGVLLAAAIGLYWVRGRAVAQPPAEPGGLLLPATLRAAPPSARLAAARALLAVTLLAALTSLVVIAATL